MGQAAGSISGSRPLAWAEVTLDDHLPGYELLDRLMAATVPGGRHQPAGDGVDFLQDVIGDRPVFGPHAISQCQQAFHQVVGPEEHLDPALRRPFLGWSGSEECW